MNNEEDNPTSTDDESVKPKGCSFGPPPDQPRPTPTGLHQIDRSFVDLSQFDTHGERLWLAKGAIELDTVCVLAGPEKSGKSWMLLDLVVAVITDEKWLGHFDIDENFSGRVLIIESENGPRTTVQRIQRLARARGYNPTDVVAQIDYYNRGLNLDDPDLGMVLRELSRSFNVFRAPSLVVIDPLRGHLAGNEDIATDMSAAMRGARHIRNVCDCPTIIAHHLNKGGKMSGSRALRTAADLIIEGTDCDDPVYTTVGRHLRNGVDDVARPFQVEISHVNDGDDTIAETRCTIRFCDERASSGRLSDAATRLLALLEDNPRGLNVRQIRDALGGMKNQVWTSARDQLTTRGLISSQRMGRNVVWVPQPKSSKNPAN